MAVDDREHVKAARTGAIGSVIVAIIGAIAYLAMPLMNPRSTPRQATGPSLSIAPIENVGNGLSTERSTGGDVEATGGDVAVVEGGENVVPTRENHLEREVESGNFMAANTATDTARRDLDLHSKPMSQRITATGTGYPPANISGAGPRRAAARRAAKLDAMRQLAEAIQVHLKSESRLKNQSLDDDIETRTNVILKRVIVVDEKQTPDEGIEITVEAPVAGQIDEPGGG